MPRGPRARPTGRRSRGSSRARTAALPFFGDDDGLFPGRARRGRVVGPLAGDRDVRYTLAVLFASLLTVEVIEALPRAGVVVLDGSFVREPLYGAIVRALVPATDVRVNADSVGHAAGAALLASHETRRRPAPLDLALPEAGDLPDLVSYRAAWRDRFTLETLT